MWRRRLVTATIQYNKTQCRQFHASWQAKDKQSPVLVSIDKATFYRNHPTADDTPTSNPPLFRDFTFQLRKSKDVQLEKKDDKDSVEHWAIVSDSSLARTTLLQVLAGSLISIPPTARSYPYLSQISKSAHHAVKYVGFDAERGSSVGGTSVRGAYLSARYESRREETDYSLLAYLTGHTELNALEHQLDVDEKQILDEAVQKLNLEPLLDMPVSNLSNGQTRRARIAKALMARPELLLLDGPYMGLDPNTLSNLDSVLHDLARRQSPSLVLSLRPEDGIPEWITHLVVTDDSFEILRNGTKKSMFKNKRSIVPTDSEASNQILAATLLPNRTLRGPARDSKDGFSPIDPPLPSGEALIELSGVKVSYGDKTVLGNWTQPDQSSPGLFWSLHRGQRAGIFGPNGSGKTTLLSLITSDHPQAYSLPIKLFGRSRSEPGVSLFDLQRRIGHSSPEIHAFFPRHITVRRAIESAWSDAPLAKPNLTVAIDRRVDAAIRWFAEDLHPSSTEKSLIHQIETLAGPGTIITDPRWQAFYDEHFHSDVDIAWADKLPFSDLSFSAQRLVLFLRAILHAPDLIILDEAFSGMDEPTRDKCFQFLARGETRTPPIPTLGGGQQKRTESVLSRLGKVTVQGLHERQALLVVSHRKEDVPGSVREWIRLPEANQGEPPRMGAFPGPLEMNASAWEEVWKREEEDEAQPRRKARRSRAKV